MNCNNRQVYQNLLMYLDGPDDYRATNHFRLMFTKTHTRTGVMCVIACGFYHFWRVSSNRGHGWSEEISTVNRIRTNHTQTSSRNIWSNRRTLSQKLLATVGLCCSVSNDKTESLISYLQSRQTTWYSMTLTGYCAVYQEDERRVSEINNHYLDICNNLYS